LYTNHHPSISVNNTRTQVTQVARHTAKPPAGRRLRTAALWPLHLKHLGSNSWGTLEHSRVPTLQTRVGETCFVVMQQTDNLLICAPTIDSRHRSCIDDEDDDDIDNNNNNNKV